MILLEACLHVIQCNIVEQLPDLDQNMSVGPLLELLLQTLRDVFVFYSSPIPESKHKRQRNFITFAPQFCAINEYKWNMP